LSYGVVWSEAGGLSYSGKLELLDRGLRLEGSGPNGSLARREIAYADVRDVRLGHGRSERVGGRPSVILDRRGGEPVRVEPVEGLEGPGVAFELGLSLAELVSRSATAARVAVVVPIKREARERARRLVADGPPFDPRGLRLERHHVFVSDREVVFVFEGDAVQDAVERLARSPAVWKAAAGWRDCLAGRPRVAVEEYGWVGGSAWGE
jgi:hypothetical protein